MTALAVVVVIAAPLSSQAKGYDDYCSTVETTYGTEVSCVAGQAGKSTGGGSKVKLPTPGDAAKYLPAKDRKAVLGQYNRYGTPTCIALPNGAALWDGTKFVAAPKGQCDLAALQANIAPGDLAAIAIARLTIVAPEIGFGPAPSVNQWNRAFVGYPYWLWVEGDSPTSATSSEWVAGLQVSLTVRLVGVTWDMGDGTAPFTCGVGTAWGRNVVAGTPSPTCGHRYQKPSLPAGDYTITTTARWTIDWQVAGASGSQPLQLTRELDVPVGELQTVRRR